MAEDQPVQGEVSVPVAGEVKIGLGQISNPTPLWATWVFRVVFYLSAFATIVITTDPHIPAAIGLQIIFYLTLFTTFIHGLSRFVGIDTRALEAEAKDAFIPVK